MPGHLQSNTARQASRGGLKIPLLLLAASFALAYLLFLLLPDVFDSWNSQAFDQLFRIRSRTAALQPAYDNTIVHVDINNTSLQDLSEFYLNRSHYAKVTRNLHDMRVAAQVYDFIFAFPQDPSQDKEMAEAAAAAGNAYFGVAFGLSGSQESSYQDPAVEEYLRMTGWPIRVEGDAGSLPVGTNPLPTFHELAAAARGLGALNVQADPDGVIRRFPMLVRYGGVYYPSLPLRVMAEYLGVTPDRVVLHAGRSITLQNAHRPGEEARDISIPIDVNGNFRINFIGAWDRMTHYNFSDVYRASDDRDELELFGKELAGKIVTVADVSANSRDVGPVPTDGNFPLSGLLSNVMHNILTGSFLRELSFEEMLLVELALLTAVFALSLKLSPVQFALGVVGLGVVYLTVSAAAFFYFQAVFRIVRPMLMLSFALTSNVAYRYIVEERNKAFLRRTFEAYFPPAVVERIMANPELITTGERKELTIMFSDIAGFTRMSATMAPDRIQMILNEYFEAMVDIAFRYDGTVDKFMGDGLMVFFGDPVPHEDHALRCVRMAIDMQRKMRELAQSWQAKGETPLQLRIGINTGMVVVGNMGSARRLSYTALGSDVNLAQRLESNAPIGGILISQSTADRLQGEILTRSAGKIKVKGLDEPIDAFEVPVD